MFGPPGYFLFMIVLLFTLATFASGDGGSPAGGSLAMAGRMAKKFLGLGGAIVYHTAVEKVLVRNGAATGVLADGREIPAAPSSTRGASSPACCLAKGMAALVAATAAA